MADRLERLEHLIGLGFLVTFNRLEHIERTLHHLAQVEAHEMAQIDDLVAEVSQNTDAVASAKTALETLSQLLKDALAANDPAAIQAVIDQLDANSTALADAVAANTPAAPEPPA